MVGLPAVTTKVCLFRRLSTIPPLRVLFICLFVKKKMCNKHIFSVEMRQKGVARPLCHIKVDVI